MLKNEAPLHIAAGPSALYLGMMKPTGMLLLSFLFLLEPAQTQALLQNNDEPISAQKYVELYKGDAIKEMYAHGVPASITLAQGMLESGNGNSDLAREANNHFGIKCHTDWTGETFIKDDDKEDECFRKYKTVLESYTDHSLFIKNKQRYASLFDLEITDYRGWAYGLKAAGYATDPDYPKLLIKIIEENRLFLYDNSLGGKRPKPKEVKEPTVEQPKKINKEEAKAPAKAAPAVAKKEKSVKHHVLTQNGVRYVEAADGDSYQSISKEFDTDIRLLYNYNDIENDNKLTKGERVYLKPKRSKAKTEYHTVKEGETMHAISQQHGIKLKKLYQKNNMKQGAEPKPGQQLWLKKQKPTEGDF